MRSLAQFERPPELWVVTRAPRPSTAASCQAPGPIAFPYPLRIHVHYPERPAGGSQVRAQLVGAKPKDRSSPYGTPKGVRSPLASPLVTDPQQARARGPAPAPPPAARLPDAPAPGAPRWGRLARVLGPLSGARAPQCHQSSCLLPAARMRPCALTRLEASHARVTCFAASGADGGRPRRRRRWTR